MSTLSIASPEIAGESEVDTRFDALVRCPVPAQRDGHLDFETVFDLDYGQAALDAAPVVHQPRSGASRVRTAVPQPARRTAVKLTRRGRLVLVLAFLAIAVALMIPLGGWATASLTGGSPEPVRVVEVGPGDTLYGIAADLAEPGEIRAMVHRIQELNSLPGGQIAEGQKLAVPRG
jgi:hypothetical protein